MSICYDQNLSLSCNLHIAVDFMVILYMYVVLSSHRLIQFYIRIGSSSSSSSSRCDASDTANEGVLLLYSTNYGITWNQLQFFNYYSYRTSQFVNILLPSSVRTPLTRFAWWQPQNSAANQDEWAIDDVYIGGDDLNPTNMFETFDPINDNNWVFYHGAAVNSYCGSKGHSLVFR